MNEKTKQAEYAVEVTLKERLSRVPKTAHGWYDEKAESVHTPYGKLMHMALAEIERLEALIQLTQNVIIEEQRKTIESLNMCIGGEGSTTTENLTLIGRLEAEIESLKQTAQPAQEPKTFKNLSEEEKKQVYKVAKRIQKAIGVETPTIAANACLLNIELSFWIRKNL